MSNVLPYQALGSSVGGAYDCDGYCANRFLCQMGICHMPYERFRFLVQMLVVMFLSSVTTMRRINMLMPTH